MHINNVVIKHIIISVKKIFQCLINIIHFRFPLKQQEEAHSPERHLCIRYSTVPYCQNDIYRSIIEKHGTQCSLTYIDPRVPHLIFRAFGRGLPVNYFNNACAANALTPTVCLIELGGGGHDVYFPRCIPEFGKYKM